MKNLKKQSWLVLLTATGINFLAGLLYIWSVIKSGLKAPIADGGLGWTDTEATLPYTIAIVSFVICMVAIGKLQDMKGPRLTATLSGILMGSGLILSSLHTNPILMIITFGVITGAGCGISNVSTVPPAVKWFPSQQKRHGHRCCRRWRCPGFSFLLPLYPCFDRGLKKAPASVFPVLSSSWASAFWC